MATTASLTVTITDSANAPLADIRDSLASPSLINLNLSIGGYQGLPSDNAAKLAFIKTQVINFIMLSYAAIKANQTAIANQAQDQANLATAQSLASQILLS